MEPVLIEPPAPVVSAADPMTQYFCSTLPVPMATQTFLNEEESAAMPGMSSLSTTLARTPGTCVQAFHTPTHALEM